MLKLYCFPRSGNSREVKIVLAEKNIPFEAINTHADPTLKDSPEFKKASPRGKVPAIIDGDVYMSEAFAINQYLDRRYPGPRLMPEDEALSEEIRRFVDTIDKQMVLNIGLLVIECLLKPKAEQREEVKQQKRDQIVAAMRELDKRLEGRDYLFGEFTLADVAVIPHVAALPMLGSGIPADLKNMTAWFGRVQARPSFQKSAQ